MDLLIRVVPKAKRNSIEIGDDGLFKARVTAAPERGKANDAVITLLSKLIGVPKTRHSGRARAHCAKQISEGRGRDDEASYRETFLGLVC